MTVANTIRKAGPFLGNGVTTSFPFTFKVFARGDLQLTYTNAAGVDTVLTLDNQYSIALNADQDNNPGGTITYPLTGSLLAVGERLVGLGDLVAQQGTDLTNVGRFLPQVVENAFDYETILIQQLLEIQARTLVMPASDTDPVTPLPNAAARAFKFLAFTAAGQPFMSAGTGADAGLRADLAASGGSALVSFLQSGVSAIARPVQARLRDTVTAFDFMTTLQIADVKAGTALLDVTAAIQAAINSVQPAGVVYLPPGTYRVSAQIDIGGSGIVVRGAGIAATVIKTFHATADVISLTNSSNRLTVRDLTVDAGVVRTAGAGFASRGVVGACSIIDTQSINQFVGYMLCGTDFSLLQNATASFCYNNGFELRNNPANSPQWTLQHILSQYNDGDGVVWRAIPGGGAAATTVGSMFDINCFANTGRGIAAYGDPAVPIPGVRLNGAFSGQNGGESLYLDTYSNQHNITNFYFELDGTYPTGRLGTTPATTNADAIRFTANNISARLAGGLVKAPAKKGIWNQCSERLTITGVNVEDAGQVGSNSVGIFHDSLTGRMLINACGSGNTGFGATQTYGIFGTDCSLIAGSGNDLSNNVTAAFGGANTGAITLIGGFPVSSGNRMAGGVVLGLATGDNKGAGTLNSSNGLFKNNVAYANP